MNSTEATAAQGHSQASSARQRFIDEKMVSFPQSWRDRLPHTGDQSQLQATFERLLGEYQTECSRAFWDAQDRERRGKASRRLRSRGKGTGKRGGLDLPLRDGF